MIGVEQWAEIRRLHCVEQALEARDPSPDRGAPRHDHPRDQSDLPPKYKQRAPAGSKLDPSKEWICEQLRADLSIQSLRLREMASELGYEGGRTIFETMSAISAHGSK